MCNLMLQKYFSFHEMFFTWSYCAAEDPITYKSKINLGRLLLLYQLLLLSNIVPGDNRPMVWQVWASGVNYQCYPNSGNLDI